MFMWYHNAGRCYAYLADVESRHPAVLDAGLERSRWFTRGWTLQELIAPRDVCFYDCNWNFIGRRQAKPRKPSDGGDDSDDSDDGKASDDGDDSKFTDLADRISDVTEIHLKVLRWYIRQRGDPSPEQFSVHSLSGSGDSSSEHSSESQYPRGPSGPSRGRTTPGSSNQRRRRGMLGRPSPEELMPNLPRSSRHPQKRW